MHYLIAHKIGGRLVLAINQDKKDFMGSTELNEVLEYVNTSSKHPDYSPIIVKFKGLYHIDNSIKDKTIRKASYLTGDIYYIELKDSFEPNIVEHVEVNSPRWGKIGYIKE